MVSYNKIQSLNTFDQLSPNFYFLFLFFKFVVFKILFFFLEGKENERERKQCVVVSCTPPTGNLASNPGMWPDWESNQQPFGSQARTQTTELYQLGLSFYLFLVIWNNLQAIEVQVIVCNSMHFDEDILLRNGLPALPGQCSLSVLDTTTVVISLVIN